MLTDRQLDVIPFMDRNVRRLSKDCWTHSTEKDLIISHLHAFLQSLVASMSREAEGFINVRRIEVGKF